ncbi:MAG: hypothetical protein ABW224_17680, partial [Kibdelosporangium sp.]
MPDGNPLVAQAPEDPNGPGPLTAGNGDYGWAGGIGIAESAMDTFNGIKDGNWVEGGLGVVGLAAEAASAAIDPFGWLMSSVASFLMEHVQPLKDMLDSIAGDPPVIQSYSETWANVAKHLDSTHTSFANSVKNGTAGWQGKAADTYRQTASEQAEGIKAAATAAGTISTVVMVFGEVVAFVRELVRDLIADLIGKLISWVLETVFSLGFGTPVVVAQAVAAIAKWATKITDLLRRLLRTIKNVSPLLGKLAEVFGKIIKVFGKVVGKVTGLDVINPRNVTPGGFLQRPGRGGGSGGGPDGSGGGPDGAGPDGSGSGGPGTGPDGSPPGSQSSPSGSSPPGSSSPGSSPSGSSPSGSSPPGSSSPGSSPSGSSSPGDNGGPRSPGSDPGGSQPGSPTATPSSGASSPSSGSPEGAQPAGGPGQSSQGAPSHARDGQQNAPSPAQSNGPGSPSHPANASNPNGPATYSSPGSPGTGGNPAGGPPQPNGPGSPSHPANPSGPGGPATYSSPSSPDGGGGPAGGPGRPAGPDGAAPYSSPSGTPHTGSPSGGPDSAPGGHSPSGGPGGAPHAPQGPPASHSTAPARGETPTAPAFSSPPGDVTPAGTPHGPGPRSTDSPAGNQPGQPTGGMPPGGGHPGGGHPGGGPSGTQPTGGAPRPGWTGTPGSPAPQRLPDGTNGPGRPGPREHVPDRPGPADPHRPHRTAPPSHPGTAGPTGGPGSRPNSPQPHGAPGTHPPVARGPAAPPHAPQAPMRPNHGAPTPSGPSNNPAGSHPTGGSSHGPGSHDRPGSPPDPNGDPHAPPPGAPDTDPLPPDVVNNRHAESTPAGSSYHRGDPEMGDLPQRVRPDPDGRYTVDVHVDPDGHANVGGRRYTPEEFAEVLRRNGDYDGRPVRLIGCDAGTNGFAPRLSQALDVEVMAPNRPAWTDSNGRVFSSDYEIGPDGVARPRIPPDGEWSVYSPDGTSTRAGDDGFAPDTPGADRPDLDPDDAQARGRDFPTHQEGGWEEPGHHRTEPVNLSPGERFYDPANPRHLEPDTRYDVTDSNGRRTTVYTSDTEPVRITHVDADVPNTRWGSTTNPVDLVVNPDTDRLLPDVQYRVNTDHGSFEFGTSPDGRPDLDVDRFDPPADARPFPGNPVQWDPTTGGSGPFSLNHPQPLEPNTVYRVEMPDRNGDPVWYGDFYSNGATPPEITHVRTLPDPEYARHSPEGRINPETGDRHSMHDQHAGRPVGEGTPLPGVRYEIGDRVYHVDEFGNAAVSFHPDYSTHAGPRGDTSVQTRTGHVYQQDTGLPTGTGRGGHSADHAAGGGQGRLAMFPQAASQNHLRGTPDNWAQMETDRRTYQSHGGQHGQVRVWNDEPAVGETPQNNFVI